jgi:radical SAM family uncharacterized protein
MKGLNNMSWPLIEKVKKQLHKEVGTVVKAPGSALPVALMYPNTYSLAMSNLGFQTIYHHLNMRDDVVCERAFLPDKHDIAEHYRTNTPLFSYENQLPLQEFAIVGAAITFELDYINFLRMLELSKIPILTQERDETYPLIVVGGPTATFNPEPLADFADVFIIGEGEETIQALVDCYLNWHKGAGDKEKLLHQLAAIPGLYVPSLYTVVYNDEGLITSFAAQEGAPQTINRRFIADLDKYPAYSYIITPDTEFRDMFLVEIARGCGRHCRFCMAGYCYRKPRNRSLAQILEIAKSGLRVRDKIGLVGAAISDYPDIDVLCRELMALGAKISVASLRADSLTETLVETLAKSGHKTITLAPEAGSERMRRVINKGITEEDLVRAVRMARDKGIPNVRLYIMIGFDGEQEEDIEAVVQLAQMISRLIIEDGKKAGMVTLSINPFVPKPFTPFQWQPMAGQKEIEQKLDYISKSLKKSRNIEVLVESPKWSLLQGALARGDRRIGSVIMSAMRAGGAYSAWKKAFVEHNLSMDFYNHRERPKAERLPWQHLAMGVDAAYFVNEAEKARREEYTPPCPQGACMRCGVCLVKEVHDESKLSVARTK